MCAIIHHANFRISLACSKIRLETGATRAIHAADADLDGGGNNFTEHGRQWKERRPRSLHVGGPMTALESCFRNSK
jgi:hypothetical protein